MVGRRSGTGETASARSGCDAAGRNREIPDLVRVAVEKGHLNIENDRIDYRCAGLHSARYSGPEEQVRATIFAWLVLEKGYPPDSIALEVPIPRRTPSDYADIVVYTDQSRSVPFLVVETKAPATSESTFAQAVEQAFGYANSLRDTEFALVDSGDRSILYAVAGFPHNERRNNRLGTREALPDAYGTAPVFRIVAGDPDSDIAPHSVTEIHRVIRLVHGLIWAGGKRDPFMAFEEWCKILFAKVFDEGHTPDGEPRAFQVGRGESDSTVGDRVRRVYAEAVRTDGSIFRASLSLPDDKIARVVRAMQAVAFTRTDLDVLGAAFEGFFASVFRGALGQYFTRREICRFVCAVLQPTERDRVLDPTCGSGGFLLEMLVQVWKHIDDVYPGQPDRERKKYAFAAQHLFGIEIHETLGRICQTNLMLHRDGHGNIEVDRSCLDVTFRNPELDPEEANFSIIVGNPPFGESVRAGDRDQLGDNELASFELPKKNQIASELVIVERSVRWLRPGTGRMGMVLPDGVLNNAGEPSRCPALRRFLFRNTRILAIVSLPDHAFRYSGAQNTTSLIFLRRFSESERAGFETDFERYVTEGIDSDGAMGLALRDNDYPLFLAEADDVGFTATGALTPFNDLYSGHGFEAVEDDGTILGQYRHFERAPHSYGTITDPLCTAINASELYSAHPTHRIDPKYFTFKATERILDAPAKPTHALGDLISRRKEPLVPADFPSTEFTAITLGLDGELRPREAGKGHNPPSWEGTYFRQGQRWYTVRAGDVLTSRIDLWRGCVGIVPHSLDRAIVTAEFPAYRVRSERVDEVDGRFLQIVLRTRYYRRAIRAITTGHSNRRRTQEDDFLGLRVPLPGIDVQRRIADTLDRERAKRDVATARLSQLLGLLDDAINPSVSARELAGVWAKSRPAGP